MTINVTALIQSLGKSYKDIYSDHLFPYKSQPTAPAIKPYLLLQMAREGIYLSFKRTSKILQAIELRLKHDKLKFWEFPNQLPAPLKKSMSKEWIYETFGTPITYHEPPIIVAISAPGPAELFNIQGFDIPVTMQLCYDAADMVKSVIYFLTENLPEASSTQ